MAIRVYLRASTKEQNAERAKETMVSFLGGKHLKAEHFYVENESGAKLDRPVLMQLLEDSTKGDTILIEQVDRLSRLTKEDWETLKDVIKGKGVNIVAVDLPTSHAALTVAEGDDITQIIMQAVNNMFLDMFAAFARKDYEDRKRRQAEGIAIAKAEGIYKGRPQSEKTIAKCKAALKDVEKGFTKEKAAKANGVGVATLYRYIKENK
ncbi:recombinase family protein [Vibrio cyclitrophicus]|uniref:recombinase family protein n=1 Tax=Vibrio TaxID=662 RepID=UPI001C072962|nr:recombinase family protein [Vibrio cyclitrophicus]MBU2932656.1 recombinase family protein [Vibrio cyclitrophicus]UPR26970.1 recombinase family protein [Vibrio cyclitrophicus]